MTDQVRTEQYETTSGNLVAKVKELVRQGNVRRIIVKNPSGRTVLDLPLTVGLIGAAWLPLWAALGGITALAARYTVVVERTDTGSAPVARPH
ncbi:MAG TPA: DUF4342 domain-containing protein [Gemmatimonadaceae bacterium]|nr:DUF4342 domain-containing protein [Gemmatimonadaceae bacterium]